MNLSIIDLEGFSEGFYIKRNQESIDSQQPLVNQV